MLFGKAIFSILMDKLKPAYLLDDIKKLTKDDRYLLTAQKTAYSIGYTSEMVADVILNLECNDFYKSANDREPFHPTENVGIEA